MELTIVFILISAFNLASADQKVLLDTTKESMLDWTRYPFGPDAPTPGWVEESFTKFDKNINWRSYVVCDVTYDMNNVNNWLWTPFITRNGANRMYIEIKFSLRNCDLFPGKDTDAYSNLQEYMVSWCLNQMEDIRLLEMQSIMKTGMQRTAFGFICLWAFCSYLSLFIAAYKWCFAEKKGFKL